jgi:hydroxylamine reductase
MLFFQFCLGKTVGVNSELLEYGADVHGLRQMIIYGLKGMSTYARHARLLGEWDDSIGAFTHEVRQSLIRDNDGGVELKSHQVFMAA